ncbi:MAG TPA: transporter [Candidatus Nanoarchaeia archaeon]|nr:transporter [Candidatus Nanoarchaeia archaeon]
MNTILVAFLIGIGLSLITVLADSLIKHASLQNAFSGWQILILGAIIYGLTAFGWFFIMRKIKLSTLGVLYSVSMVVFLTLVSVFYFKEKISTLEIVGISMAIVSLVILFRFA